MHQLPRPAQDSFHPRPLRLCRSQDAGFVPFVAKQPRLQLMSTPTDKPAAKVLANGLVDLVKVPSPEPEASSTSVEAGKGLRGALED